MTQTDYFQGLFILMAILTHASWNAFYSAALIELFPARGVLGSYYNLKIAAGALALVLIAVTRGRLGYRSEAAEAPWGCWGRRVTSCAWS